MARLQTLSSRIGTIDTRRVAAPTKTVDPFYQSPEYREWRETVIARAGQRCEAVVNGVRCPKAEPRNRMFADHVVERRDGGDPLDARNGQCLCGSHHTAKTAKMRAARR